MSCVQAFTAALGFAMSAGWDWLPSMHRLWLRDYIEAVSMPTPFGFFGTLSGSIFFKMIMLLALCPVMERLFLAFPLDRVAFRRKPFPNADYALIPPAIRERIYLSTPLILAQLCAILLLLILTFFLPPCLDGLMPWLLGTISALFGLIWFVLVTLLPGVWSCISYGLAITFSILISLLLDAAPVESLARFRMLFPLLSIPLIFFAMPPSDDIRRRVRRHLQHPYFPAFGCGPGRVPGPFQDAVSSSVDPVDILRHAAFRRHPEACPASSSPALVRASGQGRPLARAVAAPPFLSGYSLQAGKRLSGSLRVPNYVWCSDFT